jgi:hypothetical protein
VPEFLAVKRIEAEEHRFDAAGDVQAVDLVQPVVLAVILAAEAIALGTVVADNFGDGLDDFLLGYWFAIFVAICFCHESDDLNVCDLQLKLPLI